MRIPHIVTIALVLPGFAASIEAEVVHKWVDADGVTHYSDEPPPATVTGLEQIELPATPPRAADENADRYYSISSQWQRMRRERIELERARATLVGPPDAALRGDDTIVIRVPQSRHSVTLPPRRRPAFVAPEPLEAPAPRHPFAIPGRDWPVGLHPGRMRLRGGIEAH